MACGCGGGTCSCYITNGLNVDISGFGTSMEPFTLHVAPAFLEAEDTESVTAGVTGTGDTETPYFLTMAIASEILDGLVKRWVGTQGQFDELLAMDPGVLYYVTDPDPALYGAENLYAGTEQAQAVYVGSVLVAELSGGILVPPA